MRQIPRESKRNDEDEHQDSVLHVVSKGCDTKQLSVSHYFTVISELRFVFGYKLALTELKLEVAGNHLSCFIFEDPQFSTYTPQVCM